MNEKKPANKRLDFFMPWLGPIGLYWEVIRQGKDTHVSWRWYAYGWAVWGGVPLVAVMLWLLIASPSPDLDRACVGMAGLDSFDLATSMDVESEEDGSLIELTHTIEVSQEGTDFQSVLIASDGSRAETYEYIRVGDVDYYRFNGGDWQVSGGKFTEPVHYLDHLGDTPLCPDLSHANRIGEEEMDGVHVVVYVEELEDVRYTPSNDGTPIEKDTQSPDFNGTVDDRSLKYWVDSQGLLVRYWEDRYTFSRLDGFDQEGLTQRFTFTTTFSGVGEANTITAPNVP